MNLYDMYYNIAILNILTVLFNITLSIYLINTSNYDKFTIYIAFIFSASAIICNIIYMIVA